MSWRTMKTETLKIFWTKKITWNILVKINTYDYIYLPLPIYIYYIFKALFAQMYLFRFSVKTQQCSQAMSKIVSTTLGDQPVLKFTASLNASAFQQFQINHYNLSIVLFRATYFEGSLLSEPQYHSCLAGPDTNVSQGIIDIQLKNVTLASRGTYFLIRTIDPNTALMCVELTVLGKCWNYKFLLVFNIYKLTHTCTLCL